MPFLGSNTLDIKLADISASNTLWSVSDGFQVREKLRSAIHRSRKPVIDIDLRGLRDFDTYFVERVFIDLAKEIPSQFRGTRALVFTLPSDDDSIELRLSSVFKKHDTCVVFRKGNTLQLSGAASFESKILWHRLVNYSPVVTEVVCREVGTNKAEFESDLFRLHNAGVATKTANGYYTSVFRQRSIIPFARYYLKLIKLMISTKPISRSRRNRPPVA